jgi:methylglutaconyl-CoA hydratase
VSSGFKKGDALSMTYQTLLVSETPTIATVTLNRPELHNAFNAQMIAELTACFLELSQNTDLRVVILEGEGKSFSAGADLNYMQSMLEATEAENKADAMNLAHMFQTLATCPHPVLGRIQGAIFGGGVGLVSICDMVVAQESSIFCLSEVKLGLIPAVISPFVLRKMPLSEASRFFLTAEKFTAKQAQQFGLVQALVSTSAEQDAQMNLWVNCLHQNSPLAVQAAKKLIRTMPHQPISEALLLHTAGEIAALRTSPEGKEGMASFLEKRPASWVMTP